MKNQTAAIRTQVERTQHREHSVPLYLTSSFVFQDAEQMRALFAEEEEGNIYSRFSNPNTSELIDKICALEGAEDGWATATGMSAVFTTFGALLQSGDHILSSRSVFGSTHSLLTKVFPRWNIAHTYVPANDLSVWEAAIRPETRMIYIETPSNPGVEIIDMEAVAAMAARHKLLFVVDNCFATPVLQRPIEFGADLVIHSATKYVDGQGRVLGGLIAGRRDLIAEIRFFARHSGPAMSPFNAWVLSKSLETLAIRMQAHCANALRLARELEQHPHVEQVLYPFLESHPQHAIARKQMDAGGGIVTFMVKGGLEAGRRFLDGLKMCSISANLGDTRTIATHPASTTHARLTDQEREAVGILPGMVRISVGIEDFEDIWNDVRQALG
jgi:O-succinylhomoserine sulfhydrylase